MTTLFWWHPVGVVGLPANCGSWKTSVATAIVVGPGPQGAKGYATALLDTLDFLSERSVAAPLGATAAKSSVSLARRISHVEEPTL